MTDTLYNCKNVAYILICLVDKIYCNLIDDIISAELPNINEDE